MAKQPGSAAWEGLFVIEMASISKKTAREYMQLRIPRVAPRLRQIPRRIRNAQIRIGEPRGEIFSGDERAAGHFICNRKSYS
jgi:hypothetical protein